MSAKGKHNLTIRILVGMLLGIAVGVLVNLYGQDNAIIQNYFINGLFHIVGQIFIASLKMLVVPLVFVSIVCGTCSLKDATELGRLGSKAIGLYLVTTAIAIALAIGAAILIGPGRGAEDLVNQVTTYEPNAAKSFTQVIIDMFPSNPIGAMADGNMLQIIVFSMLFGIAIAMVGKPGERIANLFNDLNSIIMKLVTILMNLAPYGVFALLSRQFAQLGFDAFKSLLSYFFVVFGVLMVHALVVYPTLLATIGRLNPLLFLKKMRSAQLFAFSMSSSNATIPVSLETCINKLGIRNRVASFTIPLGATINMDGTSIMQGVATVFIAQIYGMDLSVSQYLMVILTATLASVGTAGVPGVGTIMLAMVLQQVNLPVDGISLILGVDRLLDMTRTAVNITGDCMASTLIAKSENAFDKDMYNDPNAGTSAEEIHLG